MPEREGISDSFKMLVPVLSGFAFSIPISSEKGVKTDCSLECFVGESVGESRERGSVINKRLETKQTRTHAKSARSHRHGNPGARREKRNDRRETPNAAAAFGVSSLSVRFCPLAPGLPCLSLTNSSAYLL